MSNDPTYSIDRNVDPASLQYGATDEPAGINPRAEDAEAEKSELTGKVSKSEYIYPTPSVEDTQLYSYHLFLDEVDALRANGAEVLEQRTRYGGRGNDAYKQERQLDQDLLEEGGPELVQNSEV